MSDQEPNPKKVLFFAVVGALVLAVLLGIAVTGASAWMVFLTR